MFSPSTAAGRAEQALHVSPAPAWNGKQQRGAPCVRDADLPVTEKFGLYPHNKSLVLVRLERDVANRRPSGGDTLEHAGVADAKDVDEQIDARAACRFECESINLAATQLNTIGDGCGCMLMELLGMAMRNGRRLRGVKGMLAGGNPRGAERGSVEAGSAE